MSKIRFGLYLIPEDSELYQVGSTVTGYDIRGQRSIAPPSYINPMWQTVASEYGFHVTITDAIDIDSSKLPTVSQHVRQVLACLKETNVYALTKKRVGFWGEGRADAALVLTPNRPVEILHDVLVSVIHPLGMGSAYVDAYNDHPETYFVDSPAQVEKTRQFYAPYIFDEFVPHFTCINPFTGTTRQREELEEALREQFASVETVEFHTLALVTKAVDESHYKIIEEFDLHTAR
ncbi:MAG TPA: hypothetical protein VMB52_03785 [Verrucomicrobiae bacterium]|nr:hypothetical protein [Verrucomicrobiae bacterium]